LFRTISRKGGDNELSRIKKILFVCGTGGITSAIVEKQVMSFCKQEGVSVQSSRCTPTEVYRRAQDVDLIVTTTALGTNYPVPIVNGMSFITHVGEEKVLEEISRLLKTIEED